MQLWQVPASFAEVGTFRLALWSECIRSMGRSRILLGIEVVAHDRGGSVHFISAIELVEEVRHRHC